MRKLLFIIIITTCLPSLFSETKPEKKLRCSSSGNVEILKEGSWELYSNCISQNLICVMKKGNPSCVFNNKLFGKLLVLLAVFGIFCCMFVIFKC